MSTERLAPAEWPEAIAETDGRQIVVAGPGTGKTEFLVRRVAHLLETGRAQPNEIILLSFSRRAVGRLRSRLEDRVGVTGVPVDVTTFHSLALRILEAADAGARPIPLTTPEQVDLVREILTTEDPADWPLTYRGILNSHVFSAEVADFLLRCSERLLSPEVLAEMASGRADWRGLPGLFRRYLERLDEIDRTDYGVLLTRAVRALEVGRGSLTEHRYVLVDEFQDTTPAQARMAEILAADHANLTVAGDPYQSIFSFRGAEVRNVAKYSDADGTRRWVLDQSFRVPREIMDAALRVVSSGELPGAAGPVRPAPHPGRIETYVFDQETAEAEWIAREVDHLVRAEGVNPPNIAVLVRSKRHLLNELSRALDRRRLPHDPPDSRLVDHPAVRVIHDVVSVAVADTSPTPTATASSDRAMRRLLVGPLIGMTVGEERALLRKRRRTGRPWAEVVVGDLKGFPGLAGLLAEPTWATEKTCADGFWELWTRLDSIPGLVNDPDRGDWRRAFAAFAQMTARQVERDSSVTLQRLFEMVEEDDFEATPLISHQPVEDRVHLTTLHQAKGLEFEVVFIASAVEGVFPDLRRSRRMLRPELLSPERTSDADAQQIFQVQEEMRLAYTAMTRARRRVVWTATEAGVDQGENRPSRFLYAAAGDEAPSPPSDAQREPVTISEAETYLRRIFVDPASPPADRLAAAHVLGSSDNRWWDAGSFAGAPRPGPDSPVIGERFRLSPSQADSYRRCPRRYVLERRLRIGDASSVYARFGQLVHDVLERAEREVCDSGKRHAALDRALEILDEVWTEADFGTRELNEAWRLQAVEALTKLYENWPGKGVPVGVEVAVESSIEGVTWIGRIDRLEKTEEGLRVVDYKTGRSAMRGADAAESIQLAFYAKAISESRGPVVASEMWYPRAKSKKLTTRAFAMHRLEEVSGQMAEITNSIRAEDWTPRVSADCKRCGVRKSCPAWPEGRGAFLP